MNLEIFFNIMLASKMHFSSWNAQYCCEIFGPTAKMDQSNNCYRYGRIFTIRTCPTGSRPTKYSYTQTKWNHSHQPSPTRNVTVKMVPFSLCIKKNFVGRLPVGHVRIVKIRLITCTYLKYQCNDFLFETPHI